MAPATKAVAPAFDSDWLDDMVNKLKAELEAQLEQAAKNTRTKTTSASRAADAATLASLERTLEKLARMEQARALVRETKIGKLEARDALERRLDKLAAAGPKKPDS
jgi:hypothetical protein